MTKSHVSLGHKVCVCCGKEFETNIILLDMKLKNSFEHTTVTGMGTCSECKEQLDKGYTCLIEIDLSKSKISGNRISPENAYRTGKINFINTDFLKHIFSKPETISPIMLIDPINMEDIMRVVNDYKLFREFTGFGSGRYEIFVGTLQARGTWYILDKETNKSTDRWVGSEGEQEYYKLKNMWKKSEEDFDKYCSQLEYKED